MIGLGKERRRPRDEVLEAIDSLLIALRESTQHQQDAARRAQTVRRLRSHGRSYAEILGRAPRSPVHGVTSVAVQATVHASERLERAEVRALHGEGVGVERIAELCGMSKAQVEVHIGGTS